MASSSSTKLTQYESAVTIVTAEVANSWFGGLFGTSEGNNKSETDPLVAGHVHDGAHQDGHAQKIHLVDHVVNQLRNINLADDAVTKRTISSFTDQGQAIPEFETIDGTTYYYLDLSAVYAAIGNSFGFVVVSANGGTLSGDGAATLEADIAADTLTIKAGTGIDINTSAGTETLTISTTSGSQANSFETQSVAATGAGTASGGPVVADSPTDTLAWRADDGIDLTAVAGSDQITVKNIAQNFGTVAVAQTESGVVTGTVPLVADVMEDTLTIEAGHGIEMDGTASSDTLKVRNVYSMMHGYLHPSEAYSVSADRWGLVLNATYGGVDDDRVGLKYLLVTDDTEGVDFAVPIPQNIYSSRPLTIGFNAYFIAEENDVNFLNGTQTFTIRARYGSNENQNDVGEINFIGTIADDTSVIAGINQLWANNQDVVSTPVSDTSHLYVISFANQTIQTGENPVGLMFLKLIGQVGFGAGQPFDNNGSRAQLRFVGADYTWFY